MTTSPRHLWIVAAVLLTTLSAACGGGAEEAVTPVAGSPALAAEVVLDFSVSEWAVTGPAVSSSGQHRFDVTNEGTLAHEFVIVRTDAELDGLPVEAGRVAESSLDVLGEVEEFPAAESRSASFFLVPGRYLLICNIPGHYEAGMRAELVVD